MIQQGIYAKKSVHAFSPKQHISILDNNTYRTYAWPLGSHLTNVTCNLYDGISYEDKSRIFIYAEYMKRKFYKDCNFIKNDVKNTSSNKYKSIEQGSITDTINNIFNIFFDSKQKMLFEINLEFHSNLRNCPFLKHNYSTLELIKKLFYFYYHKFKKCIYDLGKVPYFPEITKEKYGIINDTTIDIRYFEIIIYYANRRIDNIRECFDKNFTDQFNLLINLCYRFLNIFHGEYFAKLHTQILDKYKLFLCDLYNITDLRSIINNNYLINQLPIFPFLPIEKSSKFDEKYSMFLESVYDYKSNTLDFSIKLNPNLDSIDISEYIKYITIEALYHYKQITKSKYTSNEINDFINLIDSDKRHNKLKNFKERIIGLYWWDRLYLRQVSNSIQDLLRQKEITIDFNDVLSYKKNSGKSVKISKKIAERIMKGTILSIENGRIEPLK